MSAQDREVFHLREARRRIGDAYVRIDRQRDTIKMLNRRGDDVSLAERLLLAMESLLRAMQVHRQQIIERLADQQKHRRKD